jgi:NADH-quinone oxidoreductase subunit C/D
MFDWKEFEKLKSVLSEAGKDQYWDVLAQHHITIRPRELLRWIEFIRDDLGFLILSDLTAVDHVEKGLPYRFELIYHFLNMGTHQRLNIHLQVNKDELIPGITRYFEHADWPEREQAEMFNLRFDREMAALFLPKGQTNWPLLKDSVIKSWPIPERESLPAIKINPNKSEAPYPEEAHQWNHFDLYSPETGGNFEWQVGLDPLKVIGSKVLPGFHHQGLEKLFEKKDWLQVMQLLDRLNLSGSPTYSIAWAKTLEDMLRIKLPERAQALRLVLLELARIADHLTVLAHVTEVLAYNESLLFINAREKIYELFEKFTGKRQATGFIRLGGMKDDIPPGWIVQYQEVDHILSKTLPVIIKALVGDKSFRDQLAGPPVNAQLVLNSGVSGPAMRASGLNFDLRKSQPIYFYNDVDFDIPVGITGTTYDRFLIRYEEVFQSLRIINQVIDNLPLGEIIEPSLNLPPQEILEYVSRLERMTNFHTGSLESPSGEAGISLQLGDNGKLERVKIMAPSFGLAQALPIFVTGLEASQLRAAVASLGMKRYELDR